MITNPFLLYINEAGSAKRNPFGYGRNAYRPRRSADQARIFELLAQLSGRSIAQYAKEVAAKKKACKDELSVIPSQIETARKLMPEEEDWVAIDSEIEDKNARIQQIENKLPTNQKAE